MVDRTEDTKRPGPEPERLKIDEEDWEDALKRALEQEKPAEGWPEDSDQPEDEEAED